MNHRKVPLETALIGSAFILGLALRLANLGSAPLSDWEAGWAMQAFGGAISTQPGYVAVTAALFGLFESSNFLARLWPALAGALLVLAPWFISRPGRPRLLTSAQAVILAFGLACTPGLVVSARIPGSPMMAISLLLLGASLLYVEQPIAAGFLAGLALLSGPAGLLGAAMLALACWLAGRLTRPGQEIVSPSDDQPQAIFPLQVDWRRALIALAATIVLVGTLFFRYPQGLAGFATALPAFLSGFRAGTDVTTLQMFAAALFYQPVVVVFSLAGIVRSLVRPIDRRARFLVSFSLVWAALAAVLILLYPARQVFDLVWVILPLVIIACWEIAHYLPRRPMPVISIVQAVMLVILMGLAWYTLASLTYVPPGTQDYTARLVVIGGVLALAGLTSVLISLGWSWEAARLGLAAGVFSALALFSISALWGAAYLRSNQPQELWHPGPAAGDAQILLTTLQDLSLRQTGRPDSLDIVSEIDAPSLRWLLRDFKKVDFVEKSGAGALPSILLTRQVESPALAADYRGQDYTWWLSPGWTGQPLASLPAWIAYRKAPLQSEKLILWARSDLFSGGSVSSVPVFPGIDQVSPPNLEESP